ncbi:MAG: hypothetical protein PHX86_06330 [Caldisericia bacterium]|nr:hypothetical protein [Caldisericia bacterium]
MKRYSPEERDPIVKRMVPPENAPLAKLSKETGIRQKTLRLWRKEARAKREAPVPGNRRRPANWSPEDKLLTVIATADMNATELAEYCRSKGIFATEIKAWKKTCLDGQTRRDFKEDFDALKENLAQARKQTKELERELRWKDKALAETAVLLTLRKKSPGNLGGRRGQFLSLPDCRMGHNLVDKTCRNGARKTKACEELGISIRTLQR